MSGQYQERKEYFKKYREKNKERLQQKRLFTTYIYGWTLSLSRSLSLPLSLSLSLSLTHTHTHTNNLSGTM